jgi:ribonucleoside-diphosphate reductase alpha chain
MAKNNMTYTDPNLALIDEWAEAWSYYLIEASVKLAEQKGACEYSHETKYSDGLVPMDTRKEDVDELVPNVERQNWIELRSRLKESGIRNSTLMALMPAETSAQISNSTNGVEPPRAFVSVKQSKHGVLKQVVPGIHKFKSKYELLWDQQSPQGYLKVMAVLQKYIDQGISVNTSYNPVFFEEEKIPMSVMIQDLLMFYKYGGKQLYYFNTFDGQGEIDVGVDETEETKTRDEFDSDAEYDDYCESCVI